MIPKQAPICCLGHTRPVVDISFSDEIDCGSLFVTASKDGRVILRWGETGDWVGTFIGHGGAVWSCTLNSQATTAATGSADFTAKVWNVETGQSTVTLKQDHIVRCVDLNKVGSTARLATANNNRAIKLYDIERTEEILNIQDAHNEVVRRLSWCNGDQNVISVSEDCTMRLWDLRSPTASHSAESSPQLWVASSEAPVNDIHFLPTTQSLDATQSSAFAIAVSDQLIKLYSLDWRAGAAAPVSTRQFTAPCPINTATIARSPSQGACEYVLVCGGMDNLIYRFNWSSGEVEETCRGHFGPVHCIRFSPNGKLYASGSEDGTVRLWQTEPGQNFGLWRLMSPSDGTATNSVDQVSSESHSGSSLPPPLVSSV